MRQNILSIVAAAQRVWSVDRTKKMLENEGRKRRTKLNTGDEILAGCRAFDRNHEVFIQLRLKYISRSSSR